MADSELPPLQSKDLETYSSPNAREEKKWRRAVRRKHATFAVTFFVLYSVMLVALLAANDQLQNWTNYVQVVVGSVLALFVLCALVVSLFVSTFNLQALLLVLAFAIASISFSFLDSEFAKTLEPQTIISFHLPASFTMFILLSTLPEFFRQEPIPVLLIGSMTNVVCFAFHMANFQSAHPVLYFVIYEVGVIGLALRYDISPVNSSPKLSSMADLSVTKNNTTAAKPETEEAVGSELEAIILRIEKIHSNAEEAIAAARTSEELQKANEAESLMRDLMQRLKTKNIYALAPEKITQNLSQDEKVYLEENYLPPTVMTKTIRRRDRLRSSNLYLAIEPMKYSLNELIPLLNQIGKQWNFDTDFLTACSDSHPVSTVGDYLFRMLHLNKRLSLPSDSVLKFFEKLDEGYLQNPYHNSTHAADVMFSVMFLSKSSGLLYYSSDLEVAACVVATLGHDVGHLGFNNRYLVNSRHSLATHCILHLDNDISVLEMMHASQTFQLAAETKAFDVMPMESWIIFRRQIVEMILATDMTKHFELLTQLRVLITTPQLDDQNTRFFLFKILLKCGDIGHSAKATELHERWSLRVMEEFFKQGDAEKELKLPVSMFCDRETTDMAKVTRTQSQKGFLENVAYPLFDAVATLLKCEVIVDTCVQQISRNVVFWLRKSKRRASTIQDENKADLVQEKLRLSATNLLAPELESPS